MVFNAQIKTTLATLLSFIIMDKPVFPSADVIHHEEGIDLLTANIELSGLKVALVNTMSWETILREYLNSVWDEYDVSASNKMQKTSKKKCSYMMKEAKKDRFPKGQKKSPGNGLCLLAYNNLLLVFRNYLSDLCSWSQ